MNICNCIALYGRYTLRYKNVLHRSPGYMGWRNSTSGVFKHLSRLQIVDEDKARYIVSHLRIDERERLLNALKEQIDVDEPRIATMSKKQKNQLFLINFAPFIGFGFLDNFIMIIAGEYIDKTLGVWLAISTMTAAALGNIISDISGIGFAHYVELLASKFGVAHPDLTAEQLNSRAGRIISSTGRALGLTIGCLIGMTPLLFFEH